MFNYWKCFVFDIRLRIKTMNTLQFSAMEFVESLINSIDLKNVISIETRFIKRQKFSKSEKSGY